MKRAIFLFTLCALVPVTASADDNPSPIQVNSCVLGYEKSQDETRLGYGVAFTNLAKVVITAVRFEFHYETPFGEPLEKHEETDTGTFAPGVLIDHTHANVGHQLLFRQQNQDIQTFFWVTQNNTGQPISKLKLECEVDAVSFSDGGVWKASDQQ